MANPSLYGYQVTDVHLRAAEALEAANRHRQASRHIYLALTIPPGRCLSVRNFANRLSKKTTLDEYLAKHRTHLNDEQIQQMRSVLQRAWPGATPPAPPAGTIARMYGDWIAQIDRAEHIRARGAWWLVDQTQCRRLDPLPVALPQGVVFTGHVQSVSKGLWFTGVSRDPTEGSYTHTEIYHWSGRNDELPRRLPLPDAWQDGPRTVYGPRGALGVDQATVFNDIVVWTDGRPRRGDHDPTPRLFTWQAGTGNLRELTLRDGLPDRSRYCLSQTPDGKAVLAIAFRTGAVARFDGRRCLLDERKMPRLLTEAILTDDAIFGYSDHNQQCHRGAGDGSQFKMLSDYRIELQMLGLDGLFEAAPLPPASDLTHLASAGGRIFAAGSYGIVELPAQGPIRRYWHPPIFVYWKQLLGVLEANSPLPAARITQVFADDRDPNRLWVVSRIDHVGQSYPRDEALVEAGIDAKPRGRTLYPSGRDDYMVKVKQRWRGVWVTAYDAANDRWSEAVHVSGEITQVQPLGEHLYFAGIGLHRLPKLNWPTTLSFNPDIS